VRAITALDVDLYSNHISREVFPGLIKPLVWSVNVPLVNGAWVRVFTELIGPNDIDPSRLAASFFGRAYFNMGVIGGIFEVLGMPRESLELLMGLDIAGDDKPSFRPTARTLRHLPRMLAFAWRKLRFGRDVASFLPVARGEYDTFDSSRAHELDPEAILAKVDSLYRLTQRVAYYNIVTPLLMQVYHALLGAGLRGVGVDVKSVALTAGLTELEQYDPNPHLAQLNALYHDLEPDLQARVSMSPYSALRDMAGVDELWCRIERFLAQFGHLSDSGNDFSVVPWRETPDIVLEMIVSYDSARARVDARTPFEQLDLPSGRRWLLRALHERARQFQLLREAVSSLYTYGYGLFRVYLLALGEHAVASAALDDREDVFYLTLADLRALVKDDAGGDVYRNLVRQRREEMAQFQEVVPPGIVYGDDPVLPSSAQKVHWQGTPTSRGRYTGRVTVVRGVGGFSSMKAGDVLVIPYSDVGWTPLFAQAGAVIAESGGMLSHSSIVAREYGIPAVVSVSGAMQLPDGATVTVDGYTGQIAVHDA
jgi:pyruvate,water dikinase